MYIQHFVIDLFVKIIYDFKLLTIFAESSILDVPQALNSPMTTINQTFLTKKNYVAFF